jgi:Ankyrin repeat
MDVASRALSEVLAKSANSDAAMSSTMTLENQRKPESSLEDYYFLDRHGETKDGSALHRLLSLNLTSAESLSAFLDHRNEHLERLRIQRSMTEGENKNNLLAKFDNVPLPPSIREPNHHGATALHLAVYRNSIQVERIIQLLVTWDGAEMDSTGGPSSKDTTSLASIPMNCGSCPLHILTGQSKTINEKALRLLVNADPAVILNEDINGDNPVSLLWKNTLRFRWAISIMEGASHVDYIDRKNAASWMAITTPYKYIRCTLTMMRALYGRENVTIHDLCSLPRCPPMLLMLAMMPDYDEDFYLDGSVYSMDEHGRLPLHYAVQSAPVNYKCVPDYLKQSYYRSLVSILLEKYPDAAAVKDNFGRLPLHYALENGCMQECDLMNLVDLYPASLKVQDPVSGLYPFMLVAQTRRDATLSSLSFGMGVDRHIFPGTSSSETDAEEDVSQLDRYMDWKRDHVRMSFLLLSLCPETLQYHQKDGFHGITS